MKKALLITLACVFTLLMAGCDPFMRPKGTWRCEELGVTINFTEAKPYYGTIVIDGVIKEIKGNTGPGMTFGIYYPPDENSTESTWLYEGNLKYIDGIFGGSKNAGRGMMFYVDEKDGEKLSEKEEYKFVRVYSEGEPKDLIIKPSPILDKMLDITIYIFIAFLNFLLVLFSPPSCVVLIAIAIIIIKRKRNLRKKK